MIKRKLSTTETEDAVVGFLMGAEAVSKQNLYSNALKQKIARENGFSVYEDFDAYRHQKNIEFFEKLIKSEEL